MHNGPRSILIGQRSLFIVPIPQVEGITRHAYSRVSKH
nr:MAG TPA: hypothetical protein [Caudoviricetes sp.]